uniref:Gonadotropin-releasing hormone receptor n=1 Tax=Ciona intestinalis TaxID=7719 RepID=D2KZ68_CIOIN|nr:gonadotropin-releasing hormone receptor [Ciona intestinalis]BAI66406.1 gonadotropin-releasing hormone receptor [Ciona intestinalis]|eukprot:NP_001165352.1 gonadotropin-releasing hormone receptor [Ciona intestinalis]
MATVSSLVTTTATVMDGTTMSTHITSTFDINASYHSLNSTLDPNSTYFEKWCPYYHKMLTFNTIQLTRVIITWILFLVSTCGNSFVLYCLCMRKQRLHVHVITMHLTLADLAFTFFSMPMDATWNTTMAWLGSEFLCRLCQFLKQFGMYISSLMVVVIALDRVFSILSPMSANQQRKRTKILLISAWTLSLLCAIPALFLFSLIKKQFCPDQPIFYQCVDFSPNINKQDLKPYYFFTMCVSFLIPLFFTVISYSLILCEINAMQRRDERITGRRDNNIERARMKTLVLTSLVTLSFIVLWGPYYAMGIYHWFNPRERATFPKEISVGLFVLMYFHPAVHPILYGFFMKDIRKHFLVTLMRCFKLSRIPASRRASEKFGSCQRHLPEGNPHPRAGRAASSPLLSPVTERTVLRATSVPFINAGKCNKNNNRQEIFLQVPPTNGELSTKRCCDERV